MYTKHCIAHSVYKKTLSCACQQLVWYTLLCCICIAHVQYVYHAQAYMYNVHIAYLWMNGSGCCAVIGVLWVAQCLLHIEYGNSHCTPLQCAHTCRCKQWGKHHLCGWCGGGDKEVRKNSVNTQHTWLRGAMTAKSYKEGLMSCTKRAAAHPVPSTTSVGRPVCRGMVLTPYWIALVCNMHDW